MFDITNGIIMKKFYLITAKIVMHNMMVEETIDDDELENEDIYVEDFQHKLDNSGKDNSSKKNITIGEDNVVGDFGVSNVQGSVLKYKIDQECWKNSTPKRLP